MTPLGLRSRVAISHDSNWSSFLCSRLTLLHLAFVRVAVSQDSTWSSFLCNRLTWLHLLLSHTNPFYLWSNHKIYLHISHVVNRIIRLFVRRLYHTIKVMLCIIFLIDIGYNSFISLHIGFCCCLWFNCFPQTVCFQYNLHSDCPCGVVCWFQHRDWKWVVKPISL